MRVRWRPLAVGLLAGLLPAAAWGSEPRVELRWDAPRECIDRGALEQTIEQTLGRTLFAAQGTGATMTGSIRAGARGFRASLVFSVDGKEAARREVSTPRDCRKLDESLAVIAAIMVDNWLSSASPAPLSAPTPPATPALVASAPAASVEPAAPAPAAPGPPGPASAVRVRTGLLAGATRGLVPGMAPHAGLRGGAALGDGLALRATLLAHGASQALVDGSGGSFSAWTGALDACVVRAGAGAELGGCAGLGGGRLSAGAVGLVRASVLDRPLVFGGVAALASLRLLGPLWASAEVGGSVPVLRESFVFLRSDGATQAVHRPAAFVPAATLALELRAGP